jgi:two-component system chemotaxis response regulator CheB
MTRPAARTRVLIAEDSAVVRALLVRILLADPAIEVVGEARDGLEAVRLTQELRPDVVTMDIRMPLLDGFEATRQIMESTPTPIVVVSASVNEADLNITFNAIKAGALAVVEKPRGLTHPEYESIAAQLRRTIRAMAGVKLVRRWRRERASQADVPAAQPAIRPRPPLRAPAPGSGVRVVGVGASTGGPAALLTLFGGLPPAMPCPVLAVQHIAPGFGTGLVRWLAAELRRDVRTAGDGERAEAGVIYIAPDGAHLELAERGRLRLSQAPPYRGHRPSVNALFASLARLAGLHAIGVVLTGMGDDGAEGLLAMRRAGAVTIAQDEATATIYGMPRVAAEIGAAEHVLALDAIAPAIARTLLPDAGDRAGAPLGGAAEGTAK